MKLRCYSSGGAMTFHRSTQWTVSRSLVGLPTLPSGCGWPALLKHEFVKAFTNVQYIRSSYPPWLRHKCGFKCASFDFTYGPANSQTNPMDFNQPAGFLYLGDCNGSCTRSYVCMLLNNLPCEAVSLRHHEGVTQCGEFDGSWLWKLGYPCQRNHTKVLS